MCIFSLLNALYLKWESLHGNIMKKNKKMIAILGVALLITGSLPFIFNALKDTFVVYLGIRGFKFALTAIIVGIGIQFVGSITAIVRNQLKISAKSPNLKITMDDNTSDEWRLKIATRMKVLMEPIKSLKEEYIEFQEDIKSLANKQQKIKTLACENNVSLSNVTTVLNNSEITIYKNIQKALNCVALWDISEEKNPRFSDIYAERTSYIDEVVEINNKICINCDKLLSETVKYINTKTEGLNDNDADIDSMQKALQTLNNMNKTVDDFQIHTN